MAVLAIDLGATKLAIAVVSEEGTVIASKRILLEQRGGAEVGTLTTAGIFEYVASYKETPSFIRAVGISVPSIAHQKNGRVWAPNIPGWDDHPLIGKSIFDLADIIVDTCAQTGDASVPLKNHPDKIGPVSTMAFVTCVWMTVTTVAEIPEERGVKLLVHPSHNVPGDTTAKDRLEEALAEYKRRIAGV